jgi:hypothetical protein
MMVNTLLRPFCISVLVLFSLGIFSARTLADDDWAPGIQELYRLDRLPMLRESIEIASISSYDRTGGNNDGFGGQYSYVRKEKDGLVLADLKGPGIIYRIWTPTPTDDILHLFVLWLDTGPGVSIVMSRCLTRSPARYSFAPSGYNFTKSTMLLIRIKQQ